MTGFHESAAVRLPGQRFHRFILLYPAAKLILASAGSKPTVGYKSAGYDGMVLKQRILVASILHFSFQNCKIGPVLVLL